MSSTKPPGDDDVTTFSGFGSWMSTFTPQAAPPYDGQQRQSTVHELDSHGGVTYELDSHAGVRYELDGGGGAVELPGGYGPGQQVKPTPAPKPVEGNVYGPGPQPRYPPGPQPIHPSGAQPVYPPGSQPRYNPYPHVPQPEPQIYRPQPQPQPASMLIKKKSPATSKIVYEEVPDPVTRIKVSGLQKGGQKVQFTENVDLSAHCFLEDVAQKLILSGYMPPLGFATDAKNARAISVPTGGLQESIWPILLTTGKSCYDPDIGLRIHVDEPFTVFLTRIQLSVKCADSRISVNNGDLKIAFHRTLRVPEDGRTHKLPASFGRFSVQNIAAYQKKLMNSKNASLLDMARKGGVFFPVFQREAMWLSFSAAKGSEYKVRVFVGGVNVVTGKKWDDQSKSDSYGDEDQDYILVPPQKHLDGIAVGNGVVQQFIAMPVGSGYSIEKQITGKEDVGGVQLEISPLNRHLTFLCRGRDVQWQNSEGPSGVSTPRTCGLHPGEVMNMMRSNTTIAQPFLGGKLRKEQKKSLRELVETKGMMPSVANLKALYPITLHIKMPGTVMKHKITTPLFSPLDTIKTVIQNTKYKGKNLSGYTLAFNNVLWEYETVFGAGLYDGAVLTAYNDFKESMPVQNASAGSPVPQFQNMSLDNKFRYSTIPPRQNYQQQSSLATYSPLMQQSSNIFTSKEKRRKSQIPPAYTPGSLPPGSSNVRPHSLAATPSHGGYDAPLYQALSHTASPTSYAAPNYHPPDHNLAPIPYAPATYGAPASPASPQSAAMAASSGMNSSYSQPVATKPPGISPPPLQYSQGASSPGQQSSYPGYYGGMYEAAPSSISQPTSPKTSGSPYQAYSPPTMSSAPMLSPPSTPYEGGYYSGSTSQNARPPGQSAAAPLGMSAETPSPTVQAPQMAMAPPQSSTSYVMEAPGDDYGLSPSSTPAYHPNSSPTSPQSHYSPYTPYTPSPQPPKRPPKPQETESWAMSLAAGGRLFQQIHLDPTPPAYRSADPTATALINIQLLNAVAYETLTGMLCPPTPITPRQYAEAGIPWFDSYAPESRSTTGGAAFAHVRSVGEIDSASHIEASTSVAESQKVACTSCRRNLCDCVLRPCNHAFCGECVKGRMLEIAYGNRRVARCLVCRGVAERVLGFSAPMALPGCEEEGPDERVEVVVKAGNFGRGVVFELE